MKKNKGHKTILRLFIAALAIMLVGLGGYKLKTMTPSSIQIRYHHIYSQALKKEISDFVFSNAASVDYANFNPALFCKTLKRKFKFVKKVSWNWNSSERAQVIIEGIRPSFLVNNEFVLGNKKRLFPTKIFQDIPTDSLKMLMVDSSFVCEKLSPSVYEFLQSIPDLYWDRYTVSYLGDHAMYSDSKFCLIIDMNTLADKRKIDVVQFIHDDFVKNVPRRSKNGKRVAYDLRFKNCICARIAQCGG